MDDARCSTRNRKKMAKAKSYSDPQQQNVVTNLQPRFLIIPENIDLQQTSFVHLKHPKSGSASVFHFSEDDQEICELLKFHEECRSWFLGNSVVEDGSVNISAPVNPLFLALPYLISAAEHRFVPLEQVLEDSEYPLISKLVQNDQLKQYLSSVCDLKEIGDRMLYKLNMQNLLSWLEERFKKLKKKLEKDGQLHSSILKEDENLRRYVWGILCDYLPPSVGEELKKHLSIKEPVIVDKSPSPKRRKREGPVSEPVENYCTPEAKAFIAKPPVLTTAQKRLQKASAGSKTLTNFFKKSSTK